MGIFNLFGFCIALLFAPALAFANDVRVGVSPTTGYYEVTSKTFSVPKGASVSSSTAVSPTVTPLSGGGFQQSMGGGITIEGLKKPAPFTARAAAGLQTMKNGAKKLARSNPARFAAGLGLAYLLENIGALINESGQIVISEPDFSDVPSFVPDSYYRISYPISTGYISKKNPSDYSAIVNSSDTFVVQLSDHPEPHLFYPSLTLCSRFDSSYPFVSFTQINGSSRCIHSIVLPPYSPSFSETPVTLKDLDLNIDSKYVPDASDFVLLTPYMPPDFILVDPIPPVVTDLGITNTFDSSGWLTGTYQKTSTTEFTVSNNSTSQPSISSSTSVKTETFKDGQSQGSTVTETTQPAVGGGGGGKALTVEIPTDCDFHPTLCAWMNWTKEPLEEPDHDLKQIMHTADFEEKKTISFGSKTCPAPYDIHLDLINRTYHLSFQPACDFAGYLYFFVMAAAYIFAAYISVGVVRNG